MSNCVTAVKLPPGLVEDELRLTMNRRYGVVIAGGIKESRGRLLRLGHMGHIAQPMYVIVALSALERTLHDHGFPCASATGWVPLWWPWTWPRGAGDPDRRETGLGGRVTRP